MKIAVCIKQVPTREWQPRLNDDKTWIRDQDASFEMNEPDAYALEEALRLKEKHGGEVVVCSAGPARVAQVIREALARGADRAIHVEDDGAGQRRCVRDRRRAGGGDAGRAVRPRCSPACSPTIRASRRSASSWPRSSACRTRRSSWKSQVDGGGAARQARARRRLVPVGGDAAAGGADDPERHQPAALRDAQGHHGGEEERDPQGGAARGGCAGKQKIASLYVPEKGKKTQMIAGSPAEAAKELVRRLREEARVICMILVIAEQRGRQAESRDLGDHRGAQQLAGAPADARSPSWFRAPASAASRRSSRRRRSQEVVTVEHPALEPTRRTASPRRCRTRSRSWRRRIVLLPHTYQTRDFAPKLAARLDRALITDVTGIKAGGGETAFVRPMFQGKLTADVVPQGPAPHFVTFQIGAFRADQAPRAPSPAPVRALDVTVDASAIREKPEAPFQQAKQAVDLSQAERIVSVGRGIKEQANIALAQQLADALGAEIAASRPICDAGWLPMERQVGSSGQTVAPKLYLALGISGAIQHLVGMKGSQHDRRDQQGSRRADLRNRRLRHRRRPVRDRAGDDRGAEERDDATAELAEIAEKTFLSACSACSAVESS